MAAGSPAVGETVQVGLCSGRAGMPFLVGTGTCAFMGFKHLLGSFSSARRLSSSCTLCRLLEPTAPSALPEGFGEMYLVCNGWSAQLLHTRSLANTRSSRAPQDQHLGSQAVSMKLTQLSTSPWEGVSYLSAECTPQSSQHCSHRKTAWPP